MRAWTYLVIYYMGILILRKGGCEAQATCAINPCIMFNICNDKECILNEDCTVKCVCGANSNLPECVNTGSPKTEVLSSSAYPITASCQCVHGICTDDRSCKCENGWSGNNCDKLCNLKCDKGQKCTIVSGIFAVCQPIATTTMPTTLETVLTSTLSQISENTSQNYNVCDVSYTQRPSNETMCNGWLCLFGVCRSEGSQVWCDCDPGGFGQNCHAKCCRQCVHGSCYFVMEENKEICNCQENYSGPYCERWDPPTTYAPPKEVTWHYWVVGACALVLVLLVILMVVVPYILWRNRVILVMKVVHYFQGYEDDDDRQWDAFISYKSNKADETFVVKTLFPKLESEFGFKINVHFRDFIAGETIANNIITAVQGSRRTIMIITPSYVTSEFTKFEYQVAQQEMLKRKHRIIPILLEDITQVKETMDPNLKVILNSVTYIEWPKCGTEKKMEKFWKRLELSMPKIKNRSTDSNAFSSLPNGHVSMKKPEFINISLIGDNEKLGKVGAKSNVYSTIDDNKIEHEEVYDTLNEDEMQSKVFKKTSETNGYMNVLKVDV